MISNSKESIPDNNNFNLFNFKYSILSGGFSSKLNAPIATLTPNRLN